MDSAHSSHGPTSNSPHFTHVNEQLSSFSAPAPNSANSYNTASSLEERVCKSKEVILEATGPSSKQRLLLDKKDFVLRGSP